MRFFPKPEAADERIGVVAGTTVLLSGLDLTATEDNVMSMNPLNKERDNPVNNASAISFSLYPCARGISHSPQELYPCTYSAQPLSIRQRRP